MKTYSEAYLRRRRFLLVLPLLVLPFLTLAFWALGGGTKPLTGTAQAADPQGLSLQLPPPQFRKEISQDKLSLYNQAKRLLQYPKAIGSSLPDRFSLPAGDSTVEAHTFPSGIHLPEAASLLQGLSAGNSLAFPAPAEEQVRQRLAQLTELVNPKPAPPATKPGAAAAPPRQAAGDRPLGQDIARLETMMHAMGAGNVPDPELQQLENMLEKILDIQHPERVKAQLQERLPEAQLQVHPLESPPGPVALLTPANQENPGRPGPVPAATETGFHALENLHEATQAAGNVVQAAVHEDQALTAGAQVKLRLLEAMYLGGTRIPKGTILFGTCRVNGERLQVTVTSVLTQHTILPVNLAAYDLDGLPGLYIPGAAIRDAAKQGADRTLQQAIQLPAVSTSLGMQAASTGLAATRGLLRRQARQVKVTVKAGYRLLLHDQHTRP